MSSLTNIVNTPTMNWRRSDCIRSLSHDRILASRAPATARTTRPSSSVDSAEVEIMRSTRASAAWAALAMATSLLGVAIVNEQTSTSVATSGVAGRMEKVVVHRGQPAPLPGSTAPLTGDVFDIAVVPPQRSNL